MPESPESAESPESEDSPAASDSNSAGTVDEGMVELVVELEAIDPQPAGGSRAEMIAARKAEFERRAAPVAEAIAGAGGEVTGRAWINQTLKARIPRHALEAVAGLAEVARVDRPRELELEDG